MCGICGGWMPERTRGFDEEQALSMRDAMVHRGPDDAGHWVSADGRAMLGSRRLAIIDVSAAGHMPMWNQDRSLGIVYNGECYNYTELRKSQLAAGCRFQSEPCSSEEGRMAGSTALPEQGAPDRSDLCRGLV